MNIIGLVVLTNHLAFIQDAGLNGEAEAEEDAARSCYPQSHNDDDDEQAILRLPAPKRTCSPFEDSAMLQVRAELTRPVGASMSKYQLARLIRVDYLRHNKTWGFKEVKAEIAKHDRGASETNSWWRAEGAAGIVQATPQAGDEAHSRAC